MKAEAIIIGERSGPLLHKTNRDEVYLFNNEHYHIKLVNHSLGKIKATISICGECVGVFAVKRSSVTIIDRPADTKNKFKAVKRDRLSDMEQALTNSKFDEVHILIEYEKIQPPKVETRPVVYSSSSEIDQSTVGLACQVDFKDDSRDVVDSCKFGTVLSTDESNTCYNLIDDFPVTSEKDVFVFKLRCIEDSLVVPKVYGKNSGLLYER